MMDGVNLSMIYLIYCENFYKCCNVPLPSTTIKKIRSILEKEGRNGNIMEGVSLFKTILYACYGIITMKSPHIFNV
jgi:hypothetical protein